jgi:hypothetical protein
MADEEIERAADLYLAMNRIRPQRLKFGQFFEQLQDRTMAGIRDWAKTDRMFSRHLKNTIKLI